MVADTLTQALPNTKQSIFHAQITINLKEECWNIQGQLS